MKKKLKLSILYFLGFTLLLINFPDDCTSRETKINYEKMRRDLNIMKVILDRIMNPDESKPSWTNGNTRAVYLEGYGLIFSYKYSKSREFVLHNVLESGTLLQDAKAHENEERLIILEKYENSLKETAKARTKYKIALEKLNNTKKKKKQKLFDEYAEKAKIKEAKLRENIIEFFGEYCDAISQLKPDDRITVVILPGESHLIYFDKFLGAKKTDLNRVVATVQKSDISAYRREAINKNTFLRRVHFSSDADKSRMIKDIQIMTNIFDTGINQASTKSMIRHSETWGTYIKNFGALFMLKIRATSGLTTFLRDDEHSEFFINEKEELSENSIEDQLNNFKSTLIDILGSYGHTIRKLKHDEWIGIALESKLPKLKRGKGISTLFIKARKKDVDELNKEKISFAKFRRRVFITEY